MSPEPTQEPGDNLNTSSIHTGTVITRMPESDSEDEDAGMSGYMPLSQIPMEGEPLEDEDEEEDFDWESAPADPTSTLPAENTTDLDVAPETIEVWTSSSNVSNIDMDADKINQVKSAMASFSLPSTAIPEWANSVSEDQWKEQLIHRINEIRKDKQ